MADPLAKLRRPGAASLRAALTEDPIDAATVAGMRAQEAAEQSSFERGLMSGAYGITAGGYADEAMDAELAGNTRAAGVLRNRVLTNQQNAAQVAPEINDYREVHGLGDAAQFVGGAFGQGLVSMGPSLGAAMATRLVPGGPVLRNLLPFAAAGTAAYQMEKGEALARQYADPQLAAMDPNRRDEIATNKGMANAALESIVPGVLGRGLLRPGAALSTIANASVAEGATEASQEYVGQLAHDTLRDGSLAQAFERPVDAPALINAGLIGAITGGGVSTPVAATQAVANTYNLGAQKARGLFESDPDAPEGTGPIDLNAGVDAFRNARAERAQPEESDAFDAVGFAREAIRASAGDHVADTLVPTGAKSLSEQARAFLSPDDLALVDPPKPASRRASRPAFVEEHETDAAMSGTDPQAIMAALAARRQASPQRSKSAAEAILNASEEWTTPELRQQAEAIMRGEMTDPRDLDNFLQAGQAQDRRNEFTATAQDFAEMGRELGNVAGRVTRGLVEGAQGLAQDVRTAANAARGTKQNLQRAQPRQKNELAQMLFQHLTPEARESDGMVRSLDKIAAGLAPMGELGHQLAEQGMTLAQYAQRTGKLPRELVNAVGTFRQFLKSMQDPEAVLRELQAYGNFDALVRGLPERADPMTDVSAAASTINSSWTPEFRDAGHEARRMAARALSIAASGKGKADEALLKRAFGARAPFLVSMYRDQQAFEQAPEQEQQVAEEAPEQGFQIKDPDRTVRFTMGGVNNDAPYANTKDVRRRLRVQAEEQRALDGKGTGINTPRRRTVTVGQMVKELGEDPIPHAKKLLDRISVQAGRAEADRKQLQDPQLDDVKRAQVEARLRTREEMATQLEVLGYNPEVDLAEQPEVVEGVLKQYLVRREETREAGNVTGSPAMAEIVAAGHRNVEVHRNMTDPKAKEGIAKTFFTFTDRDGKATKLSATSLIKLYAGRTQSTGEGREQRARSLFSEAVADLITQSGGTVQIPDGMTLDTQGKIAYDKKRHVADQETRSKREAGAQVELERGRASWYVGQMRAAEQRAEAALEDALVGGSADRMLLETANDAIARLRDLQTGVKKVMELFHNPEMLARRLIAERPELRTRWQAAHRSQEQGAVNNVLKKALEGKLSRPLAGAIEARFKAGTLKAYQQLNEDLRGTIDNLAELRKTMDVEEREQDTGPVGKGLPRTSLNEELSETEANRERVFDDFGAPLHPDSDATRSLKRVQHPNQNTPAAKRAQRQKDAADAQAAKNAAEKERLAKLARAKKQGPAADGVKHNKQRAVPNTPGFQRFFAGSQVTNPDGTPRVVYHGTSEEFTAFDGNRLSGATNHSTSVLGFFFAEERGKAEHYARNAANNVPADEVVMETYLSIRNPAELSLDEFQAFEEPEAALQLREWLKSQGVDGIHVPDAGVWIAFYPEQIKSATDNNGQYDPKRADIRYNKQRASAAPSLTPAQRQLRNKVANELKRMLGTGVKVRVVNGKLQGTDAVGTYAPLAREIQVSLLAGDPLSVGYHEALHDFFASLSKTPEGKRVRESLMRAAEQPHVREQLATLLQGHPEALGQIESDPEERVAYMFQFWALGKHTGTPVLKMAPAANNVFAKIAQYLRELTGVLSHDVRTQKVFDALYDGRFADRSLVGAVASDMKLDTLSQKLQRTAGPLADVYDKLMLTATDRLRKLGSAATDDIANMFAREPGREAEGLPFLQQRAQTSAQYVNRVAKLFRNSTAEDRARALRTLQGMQPPTSPLEKEIAALLGDLHQYMVDSGVKRFDPKTKKWTPLKKVANYFPRRWDASKIAADEAGFVALLQQHGGLTPTAAHDAVAAIKSGDGQIDLADNQFHVGFTPFAAQVMDRQFTFIDPSNAAAFAKFQVNDLADVLTGYIFQAVHRAEFAKTFGNAGEVLTEKLARAADDLSPQQQVEALNTTKALVGTLGAGMNPRLKQVMSSAITAQNVILLPLTLFSQFIDALGVGLRAQDSVEAWNAFKRGMKDLGKAVARRPGSADEQHDVWLAETLGLIDEQAMFEAMGQAHAGAFMSKFARDVNRKFFKWNGMDQWNRSMRVAAMVAGERFILRNVGENRYMRELGLDAADVMPLPDGRLATTAEAMRLVDPSLSEDEATAREVKVQQAIFKFVDGAVLRPNAAQRPVWASDPHYMLLFHLKQFAFSFQKTILARVGNEFDHGKMMPAAILAAYLPVTIASGLAKAALTGQPLGDGSLASALNYGVLRSGLLGTGTFGVDAFGDLERGQLPGSSLLGPTAEHLWMGSRYVVGDPQIDAGRILDRSLPFARYF